MPLIPFIINRLGYRTPIAIGASLSGVLLLILAIFPSPWTALVTILLSGFPFTVSWVAANTVLLLTAAPPFRGTTVGTVNSAYAATSLIAVLIASVAAEYVGAIAVLVVAAGVQSPPDQSSSRSRLRKPPSQVPNHNTPRPICRRFMHRSGIRQFLGELMKHLAPRGMRAGDGIRLQPHHSFDDERALTWRTNAKHGRRPRSKLSRAIQLLCQSDQALERSREFECADLVAFFTFPHESKLNYPGARTPRGRSRARPARRSCRRRRSSPRSRRVTTGQDGVRGRMLRREDKHPSIGPDRCGTRDPMATSSARGHRATAASATPCWF